MRKVQFSGYSRGALTVFFQRGDAGKHTREQCRLNLPTRDRGAKVQDPAALGRFDGSTRGVRVGRIGGSDGTRTRGLLRDSQAFLTS